jgi:hypothetical protein
MRPIYETSLDRAREQAVRDYLMQKYACAYTPSEKLAPFDGYLRKPDGALAAIIEIKTRKNNKNKYPTYMLSANKWEVGRRVADNLGVPFLLVVQFTDGVYVTKLKANYPISQGGRYDRNDARDVEPCIFIPMSDFREA